MKMQSIATFLSLITLFHGSASVLADERPNVIFLFADDLGFGDIQCHRDDAFLNAASQPNGNRLSDEWRGRINTPNLDRLASEGTDFHQFMVCSPVCAPSRVAAMTGQFPSRNRVHHVFTSPEVNAQRGMPDFLPPDAPLLPKQLRAAGYRTGHFGKWHLGMAKGAPGPEQYGFDDFKIYSGTGPHVFEGTPYAGMQEKGHGGEAASYLSIAATDHAINFIREQHQHPFFINLWLHETHHEVTARDEDRVGYEDVPEPYQTYYGAVTRLDTQVGRVLSLLDELDLAENTLVMFSSDNGPENFTSRLDKSVGSSAGMRGRKRSLMMGGLNVPFLCRWPDVIPAGRIDRETPLAAVDIMPTVLAATGADSPDGYEPDGVNILNAFRGESFERNKPMFWFWIGNHGGDNWPSIAIRKGNYGLVKDTSSGRTELYDVLNDRYQETNLVKNNPPLASQLLDEIDSWIKTMPDLPDPYAPVPRLRAGESKSKPTVRSSSKKPSSAMSVKDRSTIFDRKDTDKNGFLDLAEYSLNIKPNPPPEERFKRFDRDEDGKLSREEFANP